MMLTGTVPWEIAHQSDESYKCMTNGFMKGLLKSWDLIKFVDDDTLDLFENIFQDEVNRISLEKIRMHPWMRKLNEVEVGVDVDVDVSVKLMEGDKM